MCATLPPQLGKKGNNMKMDDSAHHRFNHYYKTYDHSISLAREYKSRHRKKVSLKDST